MSSVPDVGRKKSVLSVGPCYDLIRTHKLNFNNILYMCHPNVFKSRLANRFPAIKMYTIQSRVRLKFLRDIWLVVSSLGLLLATREILAS